MLPGEAPLAENFFSEIADSSPDYKIMLYRADGVQAFTDNSTIVEVNSRIGTDVFPLRDNPPEAEKLEDNAHFLAAVGSPPNKVLFEETIDDQVYYRMYNPLYNLPKCTGCHGSDHTVRGVIDIQNNITGSVGSQRNSLLIAAALFLGMVVVLTLILMQFLSRTVIKPVRAISGVCSRVTRGDFSSRVDIKNNDEIGSLGETVNTMVEGLYERFELSKFVSSSTIRSIGGKEEGKAVNITLLFTDIRGFTSYAEQHDAETVVGNLNKVLNAQTKIIHDCGGDVDKYVGDEIIAFYTGPESHLCASFTAIKIQKEMQKPEYNGLKVGIGIHSGKVILGRVGSDTRADFTAIGDTVNIASRLCDAAEPDGILVSRFIRDALHDNGSFEGPYRLKMKGKAKQQYVYRLIDLAVDEEKIYEKKQSI